MKPTPKEIEIAVAKLTILQFFPADPIPRAGVMELLARMVRDKPSLDWLVSTMVDQVGEWRGPRELRAVYCTRYKPLDGVEAWSAIPGFTASDSEAANARTPALRLSGVASGQGFLETQIQKAAQSKALPAGKVEDQQTARKLLRADAEVKFGG